MTLAVGMQINALACNAGLREVLGAWARPRRAVPSRHTGAWQQRQRRPGDGSLCGRVNLRDCEFASDQQQQAVAAAGRGSPCYQITSPQQQQNTADACM
eukprot:COSAG01_NODE_48556_length_356_cov_0.690391_1_plen_98_part_01